MVVQRYGWPVMAAQTVSERTDFEIFRDLVAKNTQDLSETFLSCTAQEKSEDRAHEIDVGDEA